MAGKVQKVSQHTLNSQNKYFLDANIWIFALSNITNPSPRETIYIDFLGRILEENMPIYSHSLVIAEVFNAIARINFQKFKKQLPFNPSNKLSPKEIESLDFKKKYRGTDAYDFGLRQFKLEFDVYTKNIKYVDRQIQLDMGNLIEGVGRNDDFNDYFYYQLAKQLGMVIVTDDGDFNYPEIVILTENNSLLKKRS